MVQPPGRFALVTIALIAACAPGRRSADPSDGLSGGDHTLSIRHDGRIRRFIVHVPPAASSRDDPPLLLAFHGGGGEPEGFREYANLDALADREGFIVVYPRGTGPLTNRLLTWNAGRCCGYAMNNGIDDVGFAIAILDDLADRIAFDPRRVYATGHSNGGMMAYRLGAERADRIAAIAPVAGAMIVDDFAPSRAVPVLHIHSVDDPRALYDGGLGPPFPLTNSRVMHEPVLAGLDHWIERDGCPAAPDTVETRRGHAGEPDASHTATLLVWSPCTAGTEVAHWRLTGAGHGWPGGSSALSERLIGPSTNVIDAATEVWSFLSRFELPE